LFVLSDRKKKLYPKKSPSLRGRGWRGGLHTTEAKWFMSQSQSYLVFRFKLVRWLLCFIVTAFFRCEKPSDWRGRFSFYNKAVIAAWRLYRLLLIEERKKLDMNGRCLWNVVFLGQSGQWASKNKSFNWVRPTASDQVEASLRSGWDECFITSSGERTNPMTLTSWPNRSPVQ
jgi:hypothetical protein